MCIYLGISEELTYSTKEHVLPAALGCCTKLERGIVSDQANGYFSPIERDVIEQSLIQIPRIINGPGKRGKLADKFATTSAVSVVNLNGENALGYMKGTKGYILNQFIINKENKIQFHYQQDGSHDAQDEVEKLKKHICSMGEKYVPVIMPIEDKSIYITHFKDKIYIGACEILSNEKVDEIKKLFARDINVAKQRVLCGELSATIDIEHNLKKICIVAAKSALNTLAYLKGSEYIIQNSDFKTIIEAIMSGSDEIFEYVNGIGFEVVPMLRQKLFLDKEQLACILTAEGKKLKALFLVYEHGFEISLCSNCITSSDFLLDGIVCDWRNRTDYQYLDFLKQKQVLYSDEFVTDKKQ